MSLADLGVGAAQVVAAGGEGQVVAVYRRAAYLRLPGGLVALVAPGVWRGPIHVRLDLPLDRLVPGDPVEVVGGGLVCAGRWEADLAGARVWRGALPDPDALATAADLAPRVLADAPPSALREPVYGDRLALALACLVGGDLRGVAAAVGGLGPGLTPSGDDALAGILLVARAGGGVAIEEHLLAVARSVPTTTLARALLEWAARGQTVEPVHDLLTALATGDEPAARRHLAALAAIGHTSGADLAFGLALGLRHALLGVACVSPC